MVVLMIFSHKKNGRTNLGGVWQGSSKMAPARLFFTEKRLLVQNIWYGFSEGAGKEPYCILD